MKNHRPVSCVTKQISHKDSQVCKENRASCDIAKSSSNLLPSGEDDLFDGSFQDSDLLTQIENLEENAQMGQCNNSSSVSIIDKKQPDKKLETSKRKDGKLTAISSVESPCVLVRQGASDSAHGNNVKVVGSVAPKTPADTKEHIVSSKPSNSVIPKTPGSISEHRINTKPRYSDSVIPKTPMGTIGERTLNTIRSDLGVPKTPVSTTEHILNTKPSDSVIPKTPAGLGSLKDRIKQRLQENIGITAPHSPGIVMERRRLEMVQAAHTEAEKVQGDGADLGPFYGLPTKVQDLLKEQRGIEKLYGENCVSNIYREFVVDM